MDITKFRLPANIKTRSHEERYVGTSINQSPIRFGVLRRKSLGKSSTGIKNLTFNKPVHIRPACETLTKEKSLVSKVLINDLNTTISGSKVSINIKNTVLGSLVAAVRGTRFIRTLLRDIKFLTII